MNQKFFYNPTTKEKEFILCTNTFQSDIDFIEESGVKSVLITSDKYKWTGVDDIANIRGLENIIIGKGPKDIKDLYKLNGIKSLTINGPEGVINFKGLSTLKNLFFSYVNGAEGLGTLAGLTKLVLVNCKNRKYDWHNEFKGLKNLQELELTSSLLPYSLSFLNQTQKLETLELHNCKSEFTIKEISVLPRLNKLILAQCPNIKDIENLVMLQSLKWLRITDSGILQSCSFIKQMEGLEVLIVNGKTYFRDGDLSPAFGKLKHFGFDNKKHYSHRITDFPSIYR